MFSNLSNHIKNHKLWYSIGGIVILFAIGLYSYYGVPGYEGTSSELTGSVRLSVAPGITDTFQAKPLAVADANASVMVTAYNIVGYIGNTNATFVLPVALANTDTVEITFPSHVDVSGAKFFSQTFGGAGTFSCSASGQVVTCTANGPINSGKADLVMTGIVNAAPGTADITSFLVKRGGKIVFASDFNVPMSDAF
jgi:hypothetical protein